MEGVLWKWTNYWNGWQTRWFILDNGVLAYYKSQEEVNQGCKGSMKVSACEINVNAIDNTRMDLVIPGEQHMYLKAASSQERQKWLVALGSAKACVRTYTDMTDPATDALKSKKSELRLYCDLLMQQVHMVKTEANSENGPQIERLNEATSLLSATCDTFIKSLEDCMRLSHSKLELPVVNESIAPVTPTNPLPPSKLKGVKVNGKENYLKSSSEENS
ncbi:pleckstrin homology domain-containing family A member 3-like [Chrysoperla carnea]|uniref:pleckstrin homology domain-containing family A member 3-like n=1 Tax=Chrysoperla carnea TaxID=189513 RepID=UPI001D076845|nr:pleckstrin homology domain-containing family A member 3-like [Chrysoperla carnea]XP_044734462.1 pleckstrin homology domain-containing family A member 3-like [Chrysoperla carnea]